MSSTLFRRLLILWLAIEFSVWRPFLAYGVRFACLCYEGGAHTSIITCSSVVEFCFVFIGWVRSRVFLAIDINTVAGLPFFCFLGRRSSIRDGFVC